MKRILIITYYWPPSGGGGVQRWLKFSKYLPQFGWKPIIYTPKNPDSSIEDQSLLSEVPVEAEVIKTPIWEPYQLYRSLTGKKKGQKFKAGYIAEASKSGFLDRLSVFARGNLLIPDPRMFWIKPSIKYLKNYLRQNPVDLIVSTGPPHSMHLIALGLKKHFNIPWLADFRDPWVNIDFYNKLRLTKWADRRHHKLEKRVIGKADIIVTVSENWANQFEKDHNKKVHVVTNGFDPEDFEGVVNQLDKEFSITHIGAFNQDRNPVVLWEVLKELCHENEIFKRSLRINLIGQTDQQIIDSIKKNGLGQALNLISHVGHKEIANHLTRSQLLLLPINNTPNAKGIIPGKAFEYMAAQRPVLVIGPADGDTAKVIRKENAGEICPFADKEGMKTKLLDYFLLFKDNQLFLDKNDFKQFSRKILANQIISLYDKIVQANGRTI